MNIYEEVYKGVKEAREEFNKATNEEEREAARAIYLTATSKLEGCSRVRTFIWHDYKESKTAGNKYLDFCEPIWEEEVEEFISELRENDIYYFTYSSTWSSAVEIAWLFQVNGCTLEGLVEVNHGDEKAHGYLFKVNYNVEVDMKTYYSVNKAEWGYDWDSKYWFTDYETAKEFSRLDYTGAPVKHTFKRENMIAMIDELIDTQFVDQWTGETWDWKAEL